MSLALQKPILAGIYSRQNNDYQKERVGGGKMLIGV